MFQVQIGSKVYRATFEHYPPEGVAIAGATFCMIDEITDNNQKTVSYGSFAVRKEEWSKHSKNARRKEALREALLACNLFDAKQRKKFWNAYHEKRGYKGNAQVTLTMTDNTLSQLNAVADWQGQTKKTALKEIVGNTYDNLGVAFQTVSLFRGMWNRVVHGAN